MTTLISIFTFIITHIWYIVIPIIIICLIVLKETWTVTKMAGKITICVITVIFLLIATGITTSDTVQQFLNDAVIYLQNFNYVETVTDTYTGGSLF